MTETFRPSRTPTPSYNQPPPFILATLRGRDPPVATLAQKQHHHRRGGGVIIRFMTFDSKARLSGLLGAATLAALSMAALLPTKWVPRTGLGWQVEHFSIYFATAFVLCIAFRRPYDTRSRASGMGNLCYAFDRVLHPSAWAKRFGLSAGTPPRAVRPSPLSAPSSDLIHAHKYKRGAQET